MRLQSQKDQNPDIVASPLTKCVNLNTMFQLCEVAGTFFAHQQAHYRLHQVLRRRIQKKNIEKFPSQEKYFSVTMWGCQMLARLTMVIISQVYTNNKSSYCTSETNKSKISQTNKQKVMYNIQQGKKRQNAEGQEQF